MPEDTDLKIETPGDQPIDTAPAAAERAAAYAEQGANDSAATIAALQTENAQLRAQVDLLNAHIQDFADGTAKPQAQAAEPKEARLIGEDWSNMTSAEAKAAGCTMKVLCRDGYYVP